ncbi:MAG: response regulator [Sphingobacteriales bacterium]|nr:response regulator [Sphingobacteriales bacterium]
MKTILPNFFSSITREFVNDISWWFNAAVFREGQRYIIRIKLLQIVAFLTFLIITLLNYFSLLPYTYTITAVATVLLMFSRFLINKGRLEFAKGFILAVTCSTIFLLNYFQGTSSGYYFYYFIVLIITIFAFEERNSQNDIQVTYLFLFLSATATFLFCPEHGTIQEMPVHLVEFNFFFNLAITFILGFLLSYVMIRDNQIREKALLSKQKFLDSIYNTSLDAVFIIDVDTGKITDNNFQSLKLFEANTDAELRGQNLGRFLLELENEDNDKGFSKMIYREESYWQGEMRCKTINQHAFAGYVSVVPFTYEGRKLKKLNIIDISDIKKAEAALKEAKEKAERLAEVKSKFLSNMSHELRTPLNGIIGTTNLLIHESHMPTQRQHYDILKYSSEHMLNLINDILDYSKIEAGKMELEKNPFNLQKTFSKLTSMFHNQFEQKGVQFECQFDKRIVKDFLSDEVKLSQILSNLLSNALKFTPAGGKVVLSVTQYNCSSEKTTLEFSVRDTGVGIPEDKQQRIFESFTQVDTATTRKFGGTGLGLTISKHFVEMFGSKLKLISAPGKGSCFYFFAEFENNQLSSGYINETAVKGLQSLKGLKALLAEDNPINMMVAKRFLQRWDIEVTEAENGAIALQKFEQGDFDVMLVDLEMPEMDGYQLVKEVKRRGSAIPVIAFTAAVFDNMQKILLESGFNDFIQKPFRPEDLHKKLSRVYLKKQKAA